MESGILKMFNPSSNLKHTSYSKSRLYSGVQDILSCFLFLQIFAMVSITPCYSSLVFLSHWLICCRSCKSHNTSRFPFRCIPLLSICPPLISHSHALRKPGETPSCFDVTKSILGPRECSLFWIIRKMGKHAPGHPCPDSPVWKAVATFIRVGNYKFL